jgi:integrase
LKTKAAPGIRYREHPTRRHGAQRDRYYSIRITVDGRLSEEALGWGSQGWTLKRAQEELAKLRLAARTGEGPATLRQKRAAARQQATRVGKTVADLWDRYAKDVVAATNKPSTTVEKHRIWNRRISPMIGALQIKEVTQEHVDAVVRAPIKLDTASHTVSGKGEAANIYQLLHHMFKKALDWQLRPRELGNPLETVDQPKVPRRERLLTTTEISALLQTLDAEMAPPEMSNSGHPLRYREIPQVVAAIRATILTGARIDELLKLEWDHIRRDEMELHLPDTKTGFSRRPISPEALALADSVEPMPGVPFVFRGVKDPTRPLLYATVEKAFRRIAAKAGVKNCTLHTIRHWFATMTANNVSNPRVGMSLTGHKSHAAYMRYVHADKQQAQALAQQIGALTTELAKPRTNVVTMPTPHTKQNSA